jgi:class 3 adenylate cyclase
MDHATIASLLLLTETALRTEQSLELKGFIYSDPCTRGLSYWGGTDMRCLNCGAAFSETDAYCGHCGNSIAPDHPNPGSEGNSSSQAERRRLTVMFCDLVGSTELSGRLDPEELHDLIRQYRQTCAEVIGRYGGHVAQFLGDGLLVYFGYPLAHEDDARRAVSAGLDIVTAISQLRERLAKSLQVRVAIHTGLAVVGQLGDGTNPDALVIAGETPNIAGRLQSTR